MIVFCHADGRKQSFLSCCRATQIKTYSWDNAQVILVGNKCDMEDERIVPLEKGKHLADQLGTCHSSSIYFFFSNSSCCVSFD